MKLFLTSALSQTIGLLKDRIADSADRVLFITNAADPFDVTPWVDADREAFKNNGFKVEDVDLRTYNLDQFEMKLKNADIIHFCGGSVFYLLSLLKNKGFEDIIIKYVKNEQIIYTGTSAGSIIVAPTCDIYQYDTDENPFYKNSDEAKGLDLAHVVILPHCNNPEFTENNKNVVAHASTYHIPLLLLHDNHALWVGDSIFEVLQTK